MSENKEIEILVDVLESEDLEFEIINPSPSYDFLTKNFVNGPQIVIQWQQMYKHPFCVPIKPMVDRSVVKELVQSDTNMNVQTFVSRRIIHDLNECHPILIRIFKLTGFKLDFYKFLSYPSPPFHVNLHVDFSKD